jgi:hypothetical protein
MMCSGPDGSGGDLSAARPALPSAFSDALERALMDFRGGRSYATAREFAHQLSGLAAAWTFADPASKSAANDTPATSAARFIAQTPQPTPAPNGNLPIVNELTSSKFLPFPGFL